MPKSVTQSSLHEQAMEEAEEETMADQKYLDLIEQWQLWNYEMFLLNNPLNDADHLLTHAALGISGELYELLWVVGNHVEELGDCFSYLMLAASVLGFDAKEWVLTSSVTPTLVPPGISSNDVCQNVMAFHEGVKREIFAGRRPSGINMERTLARIGAYLLRGTVSRGISLEVVIKHHVDKVSEKYAANIALVKAKAPEIP